MGKIVPLWTGRLVKENVLSTVNNNGKLTYSWSTMVSILLLKMWAFSHGRRARVVKETMASLSQEKVQFVFSTGEKGIFL